MTQGKSAEGEREEPETDNINQNSSGWGRKDFKASKKTNHPNHIVGGVFLEAGRAVAVPRGEHPPRAVHRRCPRQRPVSTGEESGAQASSESTERRFTLAMLAFTSVLDFSLCLTP